jgi:hypothetical protein
MLFKGRKPADTSVPRKSADGKWCLGHQVFRRLLPVIFYEPSEITAEGTLLSANATIGRALQDPSGLLPDHRRSPKWSDTVFISYSHKDKEFLSRLLVHLRPLERQGLIGLWADVRMTGGERWREEVQEALK